MVKTREPDCELIDSTRIWWIQPSLQESGDYVERVKSVDGYKYFLCVREDSPLVDRKEITRLAAFSFVRRKTKMSDRKEGWGFPRGSKKAHYFQKDGRSICNKFGFYSGPTEQGNDDNSDNCTACKKILHKKRAKQMLKKLEEGRRIMF